MEIGRGRTQIRWKGIACIFFTPHASISPPHRHLFLKPYASLKMRRPSETTAMIDTLLRTLQRSLSMSKNFSHFILSRGFFANFTYAWSCLPVWTCHQNGSWRVKKKKSQPSGEEKLPNKVRPQLRLSLPERKAWQAFLLMRFWLVFSSPENDPRKRWGAEVTTLTERRAGLGPAHRRHDDKAKALVLARRISRRKGWTTVPHHTAAAAAATADAAGAATALSSPCSGSSGCPAVRFSSVSEAGWLLLWWDEAGECLVLSFGGCARDIPHRLPASAKKYYRPPLPPSPIYSTTKPREWQLWQHLAS